MRAVVPFDARDPKTRLAPLLDADDRSDFAAAMLADVCAALRETGVEPRVLSTAPIDAPPHGVPVDIDDRPLTPAVNAVLDDVFPAGAADGACAVVMADLALATPAALNRLFGAADGAGSVTIAPGRGGGTNALVVRSPAFRVDYHGVSCRDHRDAAADAGARVVTVDSFRLAADVDDPPDLAEVLLHADGRAADWLRDACVELAVPDGRVRVRRGDDVF
jgi:2-phospho-L-lactate guanylyltransferase